jgi:crotonobetainyl-CoA:carnitine CoA-transferase CaiB-like acyl-CoA transferase
MTPTSASPPLPLPLAGLRILSFSSFGAGPWATMLLADLGAEVIKIEDPRGGGDTARGVPPLAEGVAGDSLYFQALNRNTRSLTLDVEHPEGRALLHQLVGVSDAVYNNLRGDLPARLGLDYAALGPVNPRIVCCSCSGFGRRGPRAAEPGYDFIVQALTGYMSLTGEPGAPPARCGVSVVDFGAGLVSAIGLLAALRRARETGRGGDVETSLYASALSMLNYLAAWYLNLGLRPERLPASAHQSIAPVQIFATRDGWIFIMCMKDAFFGRLCERLGRPELAREPRFASLAARYAQREALGEILGAILAQRTTAEWLERLRGAVPCAPVQDIAQALADPLVAELGLLWEVEHPDFGRLSEIGCPIQLPGSEPAPRRRAPRLGEDGEALLAQLLRLPPAEVERLRAAGIV